MTPAREGLEPCPNRDCGSDKIDVKTRPLVGKKGTAIQGWVECWDCRVCGPATAGYSGGTVDENTGAAERHARDQWNAFAIGLSATDKQSLTVGEADAREVLAARMRNPLIREAVAAGTADHIGLTVREAVDAMLAFASTIQDGARVRIAQALYEHWVDEDFSEEYCGWDALIGKETWLARADAAIRKLKEEA